MGLIGVGTLQNGELGCDEIGVTACECQMRKLVGSGLKLDSGLSWGLSSPFGCSLSSEWWHVLGTMSYWFILGSHFPASGAFASLLYPSVHHSPK